MKNKIAILLAALMLLTPVVLPSCTDSGASGTQEAQAAVLIKDGVANYTVVRSKNVGRSSDLMAAATSLKNKLKLVSGADVKSSTDSASTEAKEILLGETDRDETRQVLSELQPNEFAIKVIGDKVVICGASDTLTVQAINYFMENYIPSETATIELAGDLNIKQAADLSMSAVHGKTYAEMAADVYDAYLDLYPTASALMNRTEFWDIAEIFEAYLDAYEQTGKAEYLKNAEDIAKTRFNGDDPRRANWSDNPYNDDIAWACIAFARLHSLTGKSGYLTVAKNNFDMMYERAYSPDVLGGGLWWKDDQKDTKNSCIQCPASIAACLIGKYSNDDSYYEKAKEIMDWEFDTLFVAEGENAGQVYDAKPTNGGMNTWASTYNQGTFVGACMLLHEKYGDQKYLDYADLAVEYGMTKLGGTTSNGILNGEADGNDLIGFKGILTRWFYRYAKYTNNIDILLWLQKNADTAYGNRNSSNLIWTAWAEKTQDQDYDPWGLSAAIALLHNCEPWW